MNKVIKNLKFSRPVTVNQMIRVLNDLIEIGKISGNEQFTTEHEGDYCTVQSINIIEDSDGELRVEV